MADLDKSMENIKEASEQIASSLNDKEESIHTAKSEVLSEIKEALEDKVIAEYVSEDLNKSEKIESKGCRCGDPQQNQETPQACSRLANFCCIRDIPDGLTISSRITDFRVVYDPRGLRCCVEETNMDVTPPTGCSDLEIPVFAVRVVGCIPVNISLLAFESRCGVNLVPSPSQDNRVALCCKTTVCVDNVICYRGTRAQAEAACASIRSSIASNPCTNVPLVSAAAQAFTVPFGACFDRPRVLAFTGTFRLPACPA